MNTIKNIPSDPDRQLKAARTAGTADGTHNRPPSSPDDNVAPDHRAAGNEQLAATTNSVALGNYLGNDRCGTDENIARRAAEVAGLTSTTAHRRLTAGTSVQEHAAKRHSLPMNATMQALSKFTAYVLTGGLGLASGAATVAALQSATEDTPYLSYAIGAGVAIATVVGAHVVARLWRERDLNDMEGDQYASTHRRTTAVFVIGAIGVMCLAVGVAQLHGRASAADAERREKATTVTASGVLGDTATTGEINTDTTTPQHSSSIPTSVWLLLETGLICSAFTVEYLAANPRREFLDESKRDADDDHDDWLDAHGNLSSAAGRLGATLAHRDDHDASIAVLGEAHLTHARAQTAAYRNANEIARVSVGAVFPNDASSSAPTPPQQGHAVAHRFVGTDIQAVVNGSSSPRAVQEPADVDPTNPHFVLREAFRELALSPVVPALAEVPELPAPGDETILDKSAKAMANAVAQHARARHTPVENQPNEGPAKAPHVLSIQPDISGFEAQPASTNGDGWVS